jgi:hypothetical protein
MGRDMTSVLTEVSGVNRNGHDSTAVLPTDITGRRYGRGWFASGLVHIETGFLVAIPIAPVIATFGTVLLYIDPLETSTWRVISAAIPPVLLFPLNLLVTWVVVAIPLVLLRLGTAAHANSSSYAQLKTRLLGIEAYGQPRNASEAVQPDAALASQLDFVWRILESGGPKWMLGDGFISLWRLVDRMDASLNYVLPRDRVWARAQGLLMWLPNQTMPRSGVPDPREKLNTAIQVLGQDEPLTGWSESRERATIEEIQKLIDSSKTDRYAGFVRARNMLLAACSMTAIALYCIFWLGIVALPSTVSQPILSAALFFTTIGALVGLFQLLYAESQSETGVDDYGLSVARLVASPQLAALAALLGVVLTSLTTSTLGGSAAAPSPAPTTIPDALMQIRNAANVLVAVAFALSPGLVFSRFRQNIEQSKRDLSKSSSVAIVQSKAGS